MLVAFIFFIVTYIYIPLHAVLCTYIFIEGYRHRYSSRRGSSAESTIILLLLKTIFFRLAVCAVLCNILLRATMYKGQDHTITSPLQQKIARVYYITTTNQLFRNIILYTISSWRIIYRAWAPRPDRGFPIGNRICYYIYIYGLTGWISRGEGAQSVRRILLLDSPGHYET